MVLALALTQQAASAQGQEAAAPAPTCYAAENARAISLGDVVTEAVSGQPQLTIARADLDSARADVKAALTAFLPSAQLATTDQRYEPSNGSAPIVVVGNTVLGGAQTDTAYASLNVTLNLLDSGRDLAALRGARANVRAQSASLTDQVDDTLDAALHAYGDLYQAQLAADNQAKATVVLRTIEARAEERYRGGQGTTVAIGQARSQALESEETFYRDCRTIYDKTQALAAAMGAELPAGGLVKVDGMVPEVDLGNPSEGDLHRALDQALAVTAAKDKTEVAEHKLRQARGEFGPSIVLSARRDYLAQSAESFGRANDHIRPEDYMLALTVQQPLGPFTTETADVEKAKADIRRAQAGYTQARLDAQAKIEAAYAGVQEAVASMLAARRSAQAAQDVLDLTRSQYQAGRTDLDNVQQAQLDLDKAQTEADTQNLERLIAVWSLQRVLDPVRFSGRLFSNLKVRIGTQELSQGTNGADDAGLQAIAQNLP